MSVALPVLGAAPAPRLDAWQDYARATRGDYFAEWCAASLTHGGDFEGRPFVVDPWQHAVVNEALALRSWTETDDGELDTWQPYWRTVAAVVPRGNGKSPLVAALVIDHLFEGPADPRVFLAASVDKQADLLFEYVVAYLRSCPDYDEDVDYVVREYAGEIELIGRPGFVKRIATNKPVGLHGERPSLVVCDELHEWTAPVHRRSYAALASGALKRPVCQLVVISTAAEAGQRQSGLLGSLVDSIHTAGETETVHAALRISRDHRGRSIVFEWSAPTQDPEDHATIKMANPASWVTVEKLAESAASPMLTPGQYLQFFGNVWSEAAETWIPRAVWDGMRVDLLEPAPGSRVWVGIDAATTEDCTAVAWAWRLDDDRIGVACHVWAAKHGNAAHVFVPGGAIDKRCVVPFLCDVLAAERGLDIVEVVADPNRFDSEMRMIGEAGFDVSDAWSRAAHRSMAWSHLYGRVQLGRFAHDGDAVLAEHVSGAQARMGEFGWHVEKLRQRRAQKIDALVAAAMAAWRCDVAPDDQDIVMEVWD